VVDELGKQDPTTWGEEILWLFDRWQVIPGGCPRSLRNYRLGEPARQSLDRGSRCSPSGSVGNRLPPAILSRIQRDGGTSEPDWLEDFRAQKRSEINGVSPPSNGRVRPGIRFGLRNLETGKVGTACRKISPGCAHCYAENATTVRNLPHGSSGLPYTAAGVAGAEIFLDSKILGATSTQRSRKTYFVRLPHRSLRGFVSFRE